MLKGLARYTSCMMTTTILDGKATAAAIYDHAADRVQAIKKTSGVIPCLTTVLVGDDPASVTYTQMKRNRCEKIGMTSRKVELPTQTTTKQLVEQIDKLGCDPHVHGILLQHPVPDHIDERTAFEAIPSSKDVDGVTIASFGAVAFDLPSSYGSATPAGIMRLLEAYHVDLAGMDAVVVGRSPILGKPMAMMLLAQHATVTICHSRTQDLDEYIARADLVVAAVGKPEFVRGQWIKSGAIVIDAGYNPGNVGDVEFDVAADRASMITPVPGGVGPMTIAALIDQTMDAAERQILAQ